MVRPACAWVCLCVLALTGASPAKNRGADLEIWERVLEDLVKLEERQLEGTTESPMYFHLEIAEPDQSAQQSPLVEGPQAQKPEASVCEDDTSNQACGKGLVDTLTSETGTIQSPGFACDQNYPGYASCTWIIQVPEDKRISLTFSSFSLEDSVGCTYDFLHMYDGPNALYPELGKYCGLASPSSVTSSKNALYITFTTDVAGSSTGFKAEYTLMDVATGPANTCGIPSISPSSGRIVGGQEAIPHSFPFMASMRNREKGWAHECGGSLIAEEWILTAAHCFMNDDEYPEGGSAEKWRVVLGAHDITEEEATQQTIGIEKIIIHPEYDKFGKDNDIALMQMVGKAAYTPSVGPICLPPVGSVGMPADVHAMIMGWGDVRDFSITMAATADKLRVTSVPVVSSVQCTARGWYRDNEITDNMFCAGYEGGGKDSCQGDSGGPLIWKEDDRTVQYGIASWGKDCAKAKKPGIYTNLINYIEWIQQETGLAKRRKRNKGT